MKRRPSFDVIILFATGFMILAIIARGFLTSVNERSNNAITETSNAAGSRVFFELKDKLLDRSATRWRRPILKIEDLEPFQTYFLLSPKRPLSTREEKLLLGWVKSGGRLVVSFEDNVASIRVGKFLSEAGIRAQLSEQPDFKNGVSQPVTASEDSQFLRAGEKYEFYSLLGFRDGECLVKKEKCFVREGALGSGQVIALAGVPPFANELIGRADNPRLASRLALWSEKTAFDEFHQFLSEKSVGDLLSDPTLLLPLLGFVAIILLYFFFGTGDLHERDLTNQRPGAPKTSYHGLNRLIIKRVFAKNSALGDSGASEWHARALTRCLPREREAIEHATSGAIPGMRNGSSMAPSEEQIARRLIKIHQDWLKGRGRK